MFGTGLIVFRETLEAALFVGIVAASTRGLHARTRWLSLGVLAGVVGSVFMASAMGQISTWADGIGQDIATAGILCVAIAMLAWHSIWVSAHAHEMVQGAKQLASATVAGQQTLWALAIAVTMSVLREGFETVLFVAGMASGSNDSQSSLTISVALGLASGIAAGWLIYAGLGRVKPQKLFAISNVLILLLAGSLASQLAKVASQANWIPWLGHGAWDISSHLPNDSALGMVLHGVVGFDASPTQLQLAFYLSTTLLIWVAAKRVNAKASRYRTTPARS